MTTAPTANTRAAAGVRRGAAVAVRDLTKVFTHSGRKIEVLRGLNFDLRPGEMASVVGASGVGKSTLLHVLGTLDDATSGRIIFDGIDVTAMNPTRLAEFRNHEIGFVFQFHHLLPEFTALENAMMPGLIMIVDKTALVYAKPHLDLTNDLIRRYNKGASSGAAPPAAPKTPPPAKK